MRREDLIAGALLLAVPIAAGGRRGLRTINDALQVAIAKRRAPRYSVGIDFTENEATVVTLRKERDGTVTYVDSEVHQLANGDEWDLAKERFAAAQRAAETWHPSRGGRP